MGMATTVREFLGVATTVIVGGCGNYCKVVIVGGCGNYCKVGWLLVGVAAWLSFSTLFCFSNHCGLSLTFVPVPLSTLISAEHA